MKAIEKIVVHFKDGKTETSYTDELAMWVDQTVYTDYETKQRRTIMLDPDRNRTFFFYDPLDFDKDDNPPTSMRCWLDECEGYKEEWHDRIVSEYCN